MAKRKYYCTEGPFEFKYGNQQMSLEREFSEKERHVQAYSAAQATLLFAKRFSKKLGREVYIGNATVFEVEPPKASPKPYL